MSQGVDALPDRWTNQHWMARAACVGRTSVFFAPHAERPQARLRREAKARLICEGCPAMAACRTFARQHREQGFWGGESEDERATRHEPSARRA